MSGAVTVREATYSLLREFGLTTVFGNPGSTELPMFRDFPDDFRYVLGLQESVVVAMADGYAQGRSDAALVNLHSAVGVGHALGSIFTAFKNQTPLIRPPSNVKGTGPHRFAYLGVSRPVPTLARQNSPYCGNQTEAFG